MDYRALARREAVRNGLDPDLFERQISQESGFNPTAKSPAGAIGIAQIVPRWHPNVDPNDPVASLRYAAKHMGQLVRKYGGSYEDALSVYNSGRPWAEGQRIGETNHYVKTILGGKTPRKAARGPRKAQERLAAPGQVGSSPAAPTAQEAFQSLSTSFFLNRARQLAQTGQVEPGGILQLALMRKALTAASPSIGVPRPGDKLGSKPSPRRAEAGSVPKPGSGGIVELFYDPEGGIDDGQEIGAIGGHDDHVHVAFASVAQRKRMLAKARALGLAIREDGLQDDVDPVHTKTSHHYQTLSGRMRAAADLSGDPRKMRLFYRWVKANYG